MSWAGELLVLTRLEVHRRRPAGVHLYPLLAEPMARRKSGPG